MTTLLIVVTARNNNFSQEKENAALSGSVQTVKKSLAEFAAEAANKIKILFGRGVYVDENTSQAASVEFVRHRRTNYARSRLQNTGGKALRAFSTCSGASNRMRLQCVDKPSGAGAPKAPLCKGSCQIALSAQSD